MMSGFLLRWVFAFLLVALTFNPTQWNYISWVTENYAAHSAIAVLAGLVLLVGYIIYLRATLRSIGAFGMLLVAGLCGALVWVLIDYGVITLDNRSAQMWLGLIGVSLVLGIGMSWSHVRRALSGQSDTDDVSE